MPHQVHERKFGRRTGHRRSMLRNLSLSVLRYERVKTTESKAKEIRLFVDRMINLGKDGSLVARLELVGPALHAAAPRDDRAALERDLVLGERDRGQEEEEEESVPHEELLSAGERDATTDGQ